MLSGIVPLELLSGWVASCSPDLNPDTDYYRIFILHVFLEVHNHIRRLTAFECRGPAARAFDSAFVVCERWEWSSLSHLWWERQISDICALNLRCVISTAQYEWHMIAGIDGGAIWSIIHHPEAVRILFRMRLIDRVHSRIELAVDNLY